MSKSAPQRSLSRIFGQDCRSQISLISYFLFASESVLSVHRQPLFVLFRQSCNLKFIVLADELIDALKSQCCQVKITKLSNTPR